MTIPEIQMIQTSQASQVLHPVPAQVPQVTQRPRGMTGTQQASYVVVDEQVPRTSSQLLFVIVLIKTFNPPSVSSMGDETAHTISGL